MVGQKLGHYRILEKIGSGGMGEVYRACDNHLQRDVALKVLPSGLLGDEAARKRFRKEALALSKLNHPNIATVYDFTSEEGTDFLVMEYVAGDTLADKVAAGPLPEREVVRLGSQLAEGLAAAHVQGVVHRDLKPANLRLTPDGRLKILDFGLAKLVRSPGLEAVTTETLSETQPGMTVGTLPYMAPEQLRGDEVDTRTDLYAAGAVLYELAAGRRSFPQAHGARLIDAILNQPPPSPRSLNSRLSPGLESVILKALDKEPARRYQTARDLRADLERLTVGAPVVTLGPAPSALAWGRAVRRLLPLLAALVITTTAVLFVANVAGLRDRLLGGPAAAGIESLAVLPLENFSRDPEQEYFVDGMTEALTTDLAQIGSLRVISRTSAMQYKGVKKPLAQIALELNVQAVLVGSVLRADGRVRITAQLIRVQPEQHLWARSYERDLRDILVLQSEVARSISDEIRIQLTTREAARLARATKVNPEAHDAYLRGRYYWNKGEREDVEKAREFFQLALEKDPRYAPAYVGLADYYSVLPFYTNAHPEEVFPKAKQAAVRALELDDSLADAHGTLAYIRTYYEWDWADAERQFQRALALNPNDATLRHRYSRYLSSLGRIDEALAEIKRARELDPLSLIIKANVGVIYYFGRQYDRAAEELQEVLRDHPDFSVAHWGLGLAYEQKAMYDQALAELERAAQRRGPNSLASLGHAYGMAGKKREAREILSELKARAEKESVSGYQLALVHLGLGEAEPALAALERAYQERSTLLTYLKMDPRFDPLRADPRFQSVLRRMNFPE